MPDIDTCLLSCAFKLFIAVHVRFSYGFKLFVAGIGVVFSKAGVNCCESDQQARCGLFCAALL